MTETTLSVVVDIDPHADNPEKSDFSDQVVGCIEIMDDRVYITAGDHCLGFDRYALDELIRRDAAERSP